MKKCSKCNAEMFDRCSSCGVCGSDDLKQTSVQPKKKVVPMKKTITKEMNDDEQMMTDRMAHGRIGQGNIGKLYSPQFNPNTSPTFGRKKKSGFLSKNIGGSNRMTDQLSPFAEMPFGKQLKKKRNKK